MRERKNNSLWKRLFVVFLSAVMCISLGSVNVFALGKIDLTQKGSLRITYKDGETPLRNAEFSLYKVADVTERSTYIATEAFAPYLEYISLKDLDEEGWKKAAETLKNQISGDDLQPDIIGKTDTSGVLSFEELELGLYLVIGDPVGVGNYDYETAPFLISIPSVEKFVDGTAAWVYDFVVNAKYTRTGGGGGGGRTGKDDTITRKVIKVWKDHGHREERPEEITVQLLRNGQVYDTVTLHEDNNWRFTWTKLDEDDTWTLRETSVDDRYTIVIEREEETFIVTNTFEDMEENPEEKGNPDNENEEPNDEWEIIDIGDEGTPKGERPDAEEETTLRLGTTDEKILPATGALWWPVPVMSAGGLLLILTGWFLKRREEDEE